jgi:hypothetical protein
LCTWIRISQEFQKGPHKQIKVLKFHVLEEMRVFFDGLEASPGALNAFIEVQMAFFDYQRICIAAEVPRAIPVGITTA